MLNVLYTHTPPDMACRSGKTKWTIQHISESLGSFRENLVGVPVGCHHHFHGVDDEILRYFHMEQIAHGVHEYHARRSPRKRLQQLLGDQPKVEALFIGVILYTTKSFRKCLSVTVLAA